VFVSDGFAAIRSLERRDGVRIDKKTGSAVHGQKIKRIYLAPGMKFTLKFEIHSEPQDHEQHKNMIYRCLKTLNMQIIQLGAQKTSGLGAFKLCEAKEVVFNLGEIDQWQEYLLEDLSGAMDIIQKIKDIPMELVMPRDSLALSITKILKYLQVIKVDLDLKMP